MHLKPLFKYNQHRTLEKLQNLLIEIGNPSRSKLSLAKIHMRPSATMIQHLVYVNTKGVSCISCLHSFFITKPLTLWTPSFSTIQTPPLCTHFINIQTFNYITTTYSNLIHRPSLNLQETAHINLSTRNISSPTHPSQNRYQLSKSSIMQKTLPNDL